MSVSSLTNSFSIQNSIRNRSSIFTNGCISTSKDAWYGDDNFKEKAYLHWNTSTFANLGLSTNVLTSIGEDSIWELLITDMSENHTELVARHETLAGTVTYFATGPASIKLSITAHVHVSGSADYRTAFLYQYIKNLRAKQLTYSDCMLGLVIKDTTAKIYIQNLQLAETSASPDMAVIVLTCIAYRYKNTYSTEKLDTSVYAKTMAVPRVGTPQTPDTSNEEDNTGKSDPDLGEPTPTEK